MNLVYDSIPDEIMDDLPFGLTQENRESVVVSSQRLEATDNEIFTLKNERT